MRVGITNIELNQRIDIHAHEITLELRLEVFPDHDGHFMERVQHAMLANDPVMLLLTLLEATSNRTYTRGHEELEPGERTSNDPRYTDRNGVRYINVGD